MLQWSIEDGAFWVLFIPEGEVYQTVSLKGQPVELQRDLAERYCRAVVSEFKRAQAHYAELGAARGAEPYRQPVVLNHNTALEADALRLGDVLDLKYAAIPAQSGEVLKGIWGKIEPKPWAMQAVEQGFFSHGSPQILSEYMTEDGAKFGPYLREFSLTSNPLFKSAGTLQRWLELYWQHALELAAMDIRQGGLDMDEAKLKELMIALLAEQLAPMLEKQGALETQIAQLGEVVEKMSAKPEPPAEPPAGELAAMADPEKDAAQKAELAAMADPEKDKQAIAASDMLKQLLEQQAQQGKALEQLAASLQASDGLRFAPAGALPKPKQVESYVEACNRIAKEEGVSPVEIAARFDDPRLPPA